MKIFLIDKDGVVKIKKIKVEQVWTLEDEKVVIQVDDQGHPIDEEG